MRYITFSQLEKVGRLGNQLFQVASTIGLARTHGYEPRFPATWSYRPFFKLPDEFFSGPSRDIEAQTFFDWVDPRTAIYLQDLALFAHVEAEIRHFFQPSWQATEELAKRMNFARRRAVTSVHVRRGDNVYQHDWYPMPSLEYYLKGAHRWGDCDLEIFSDDPQWCRDVLVPDLQRQTPFDVHLNIGIPRPKEHEADYMTAPVLDWVDLFLMAQCQHHVLSNSTLGWWGAWLAGDEHAIYPDPWYGHLLDIKKEGYVDVSLMIPPGWEARDAT